MTTFTGMIPPVATPFNEDGSLDLESLDAVVDYLIDGGMHGLFVLGSTGEVAYLTNAERLTVLDRVVARADGRVPVIAGAIELTARRVAEHAADLVAHGADAIVATGPVYALTNDTGRAEHFRAVKAAIGATPLLAYDIPVRVHQKLSCELLVELGREGTIVGVKDSSGDDVGFRRLVAANRAAGSPLSVLSGHEVVLDGMLLLGADGAVPGYANVDPKGYRALWDAAQASDWARVAQVQDRISAGFEIVFEASGTAPDAAGVGAFKTAMHALGVIASPASAPGVPVFPEDAAERIRARVAAGL